MDFPINLNDYTPLRFKLSETTLSAEKKKLLASNIQIARDSIVFFTANANKKGLGGHTGGAYDIVPEVLILDGFMRGEDRIHPVFFDEAGHRVAIQYLMAALNGFIPIDALLHYREFGQDLYGHPERDDERGIFFSSGRLGHLWSHVNGVATAFPDKMVVMFGSDGSQQEGNDAEAARHAVAANLNVKLFIDDNDVTIAGHPTVYMQGFDVAGTLSGQGLRVDSGNGEAIDDLYRRIQAALNCHGPVAIVNKRPMAVGIAGIEGLPKAHDVIPVNLAIAYLEAHGHQRAVEMLAMSKDPQEKPVFKGSTPETAKNRDDFGKYICDILRRMPDRSARVRVVDSDLEGSCGLHHIRKEFPEVYIHGGIMERNNFSLAAGFGATENKQGIFGTFAAFSEMVISEITMARLNQSNVLAHFSHSGVDDMADNTCHFGINNFFVDNGLPQGDKTRLYFPADSDQMKAVIDTTFHQPGLRFIFSTRSATPFILKEDGTRFFGAGYTFDPTKDELIRQGTRGYIVSYGEMLYRCLDAVETLKAAGIDVGLVNKPTLNHIDEAMLKTVGATDFVLVVETQNIKTGLGIRYGTWLLERGLTPRYAHLGTFQGGRGGLAEQIPYQKMGPADLVKKVKELM